MARRGGLIDRRRVSVQWFSGTILTGFCGAALMGGAVFAALDGQTNFATVPERVEVALRGAAGIGGSHRGIRKTNRLPPAGEPTSTPGDASATISTRVRERELVRVAPFVRVAGNLALSVSELSANIPPFNPQKLLPTAREFRRPPADASEPDAEVSFVTCDFAARRSQRQGELAVRFIAAVEGRSRRRRCRSMPSSPACATWRARPRRSTFLADASATPAIKFNYAAEGDPDPYIGLRNPHRSGKHHAACPRPRQSAHWSEHLVTSRRARPSARSCAISAPPRRDQGHPHGARRARPRRAASRKARSCACCYGRDAPAAAAAARHDFRRRRRRSGGGALRPRQIRAGRRPQRRRRNRGETRRRYRRR